MDNSTKKLLEECSVGCKMGIESMEQVQHHVRVVLVDDIYTTGSTMDEVSKVLKASGVENIYYICISIGEGY